MLVFRTVPIFMYAAVPVPEICAQVVLHVLRYGWVRLRGLGLHQYYVHSICDHINLRLSILG